MHIAVAHAEPDHEFVQFFGVGHGFGCAVHHRLGDDFEQRCTGAVQIYAGFVLEQLVHGFTGVFFEVGAGELNGFAIGFFFFADVERQGAADDHGQFKL